MVKGVGIDIIPICRIAQLVERYDKETLTLLFSPREIDAAQMASYPEQFYAICFASKEAVGKALGTGLVGIDWYEIETSITKEQLNINLYGKANFEAKQRGVKEWLATWCHWDEHVLVHVLAQ